MTAVSGEGVEAVRARILASNAEPIEAPVLRRLRELPQVAYAHSDWFHGRVEITVGLREWTWNAQAQPSAVIDTFAREHVQAFSVTHRVEPPELQP